MKIDYIKSMFLITVPLINKLHQIFILFFFHCHDWKIGNIFWGGQITNNLKYVEEYPKSG